MILEQKVIQLKYINHNRKSLFEVITIFEYMILLFHAKLFLNCVWTKLKIKCSFFDFYKLKKP